MCTIHSCILVGGSSAAVASGNPLSPSTQAIRMSSRPRFFSSVSTDSQNFAPSVSASQRPRSSFWPSMLIARTRYSVDDAFILSNFQNNAVQIDDRIDRIQRAVLPLVNLLDNSLCHL